MYVMRWSFSDIIDFFENTIGICKSMQLMIFANKISFYAYKYVS